MEPQLLTSGAVEDPVAQQKMNVVAEAWPRTCISDFSLLPFGFLECSGCPHGHVVPVDLHVSVRCLVAVSQAHFSTPAQEDGLRAAHAPVLGGTFTLRSS